MLKQGSQGLDRSLVKRGQKAAERRTRRQAVAPEERHESRSPGLHLLVEGFERAFPTDGIANEHDDKIDHFIATDRGGGQNAPALRWQQAPPLGEGDGQATSFLRTSWAVWVPSGQKSGC